MISKKTERIQKLNDAFRQTLTGDLVIMTDSVRALDGATKVHILKAVQSFNDWEQGNDPRLEHDFGMFDVGALQLTWRIDYRDRSGSGQSKDASDPKCTSRVMIITLVE